MVRFAAATAVADEGVTIVVSDLHLGAAGTTDGAFVSFLEWVGARARSDERSWRIVVLGDFLDLLHAPGATPTEAVEAALRDRPTLRALAGAAASGISVAVVPGNHDSELLDPVVQARLRDLAAEAGGPRAASIRRYLTFHPWFLLIPGVLYAEHGSQYHALNAVRDPLSPAGRWSRQIPLGAVLDLHRSEPRQALLRLVRRRRSAPARTRMLEQAHASGLRPETLDALAELGLASPLDLARRVLAGARGARRPVEAEQRAAAAAVHRLLRREGKAVPVYVFGHTHRAASADVEAGDTRLRWFNSGSWTDELSFVEIDASARPVAARLRRWNGPQVPTAMSIASGRAYEAAR